MDSLKHKNSLTRKQSTRIRKQNTRLLASISLALLALLAVVASCDLYSVEDSPITRLEKNEHGVPLAVVVGKTPLAHSAQFLPVDLQGRLVSENDVSEQMTRVLQKLGIALGELDAGFEDLVKLHVYAADTEAAGVARSHLSRRFEDSGGPAVAWVETRLPGGARIALDAVAAVPRAEAGRVGIHQFDSLFIKESRGHVSVLPAGGGKIYLSGQVAPGDLQEAVTGTMRDLLATLAYMGVRAGDVFQVKVFMHPVDEQEAVAGTISSFFRDQPVPPLVFVEWIEAGYIPYLSLDEEDGPLPVEIELHAYRPGGDASRPDGEAVSYDSPPWLSAPATYSRIAEVHESHELLYVSGLYGEGGGADQTREIFDTLRRILEKAGSDFDHLIKGTYYVSSGEANSELDRIRTEYFDPQRPPASSKIPVRGVGRDGADISFDMIGAIPGVKGPDESPGEGREWGFHPKEEEPSRRNPPSFSWRPQSKAVSYTLQVAGDPDFQQLVYERDDLEMNVHTPPVTFGAGKAYWRFRFSDAAGRQSLWSRTRRFTIAAGAREFPLPEHRELHERIPGDHPRLFVRPEAMTHLRELARGELRDIYEVLVDSADNLITEPLSTAEPAKYPPELDRGSDGWLSDEWREIWWGNRMATLELLDGAAMLGFVYQLSGGERYGQEARRILMEAARWDPLGSTGYLYNTEAGMPYISRFSRAYTFVYDLLSEEERQVCRDMMKVRGEELYHHLNPDHLWDPYQSHSNRAWHFLGEAAVAFIDEIPAAEDWLWFVMNVFANVYPVWSDSDGGWFEGVSYWHSYLYRFTWWADIMREAMAVDAFDMPYFSQAGYFPMYVHPPGTPGGGFGDHAYARGSERSVPLMRILAAQASNPHWQWFVEQHDGVEEAEASYISFLRGSLPRVEAKPPVDLPDSRVFRGVGQAMLHSNLLHTEENVQVLFKSSPKGIFSHGNDAQNAFMLYAYGERLLLSSGQYRTYGSDHHRDWMMHTKAHNSITVGGEGQIRSPLSKGGITGFRASHEIDFVSGEAGEAYGELLEGFERSIVFVKPGLVVLVDRLTAPQPEVFEYRLHSMTPFNINAQNDIYVETGRAATGISFHEPEGLRITQSDEFDTPVEEGIDLRQYHLTAETPGPAEQVLFITSLRPQRSSEPRLPGVTAEKVTGGHLLRAGLQDGKVVVLVRGPNATEVAGGGFVTTGTVAVIKWNEEGEVVDRYSPDGQIRLE